MSNNLTIPEYPIDSIQLSNALLQKYTGIIFVYNLHLQAFTYLNNTTKEHFGLPNSKQGIISLRDIKDSIFSEDLFIINQTLNNLTGLTNEDSITLKFRVVSKEGEKRRIEIKLSVYKRDNITQEVLEVIGISQAIESEIEIQKQPIPAKANTVEIDLFTSHEIRHEYAKIQSVIQLIDNKYISTGERTDLIKEAKNSIQIINSTLFKLTQKLSSNKKDGFDNPVKKITEFNKIILIDDDVLNNVLTKKIISSIIPDKPLHIFLDIDNALEYLKNEDTDGDFLIFLDINIPNRNGWDFLADYSNFLVQSKVVILSSSIDHRYREKAKSYSVVVDYIIKPLSVDFIRSLV